MKARPPLNRILSVREMEEVAKRVLSYKALMYYSSAAEDEICAVLPLLCLIYEC